MTFTVERAPRHSAGKRGPGGAAVALGAVLALSLGAGEARAQAAVCTPTQTVSAAPDADGRYTTTLTCANTAAAPTAADYRHLHYNHDEAYTEIVSAGGYIYAGRNTPPVIPAPYGTFTNPADRDTDVANNLANNNLAFTVEGNVRFDADGSVDTRYLPRDGAIVLWGGGAKTVRIGKGATIDINRVPGPQGTNYPHLWNDILNNFRGVSVESKTSTGGGVTVLHEGEINIGIDVRYQLDSWASNTGSAIYALIDDDDNSETRAAADVRVDLASTGVIKQVTGSDALGGIHAYNYAEEGDVAVNLARGSRIDLSLAGGTPAVEAVISRNSNRHGEPSGRVSVNAAGTISNRVKYQSVSGWMGLGIRAVNEGTGDTRIESSGTIETVQAIGIYAAATSGDNEQRDDPATSRIEGNLVDVTAGSVVTRANPAIFVGTSGGWTVRVAEGATVRSEFDAGPGAVSQADLGNNGNTFVQPAWFHSWRHVDGDNDGDVRTQNDLIEPYVNAIAIGRSIDAAEAAVDHAIVNGTAQTVGGRHGDGAIFFLNGFAAVTVGPTGRVISDSGVAIASGRTPAALQAATTGGLSVTVARGGRVTGDIRVLNDGDLNATVAGTVDGDLRTLGDGDLYATVSGTVTGEIRTVGRGDLTVTVAEGGRLAASALHTARGDLDLTVAGRLTGDLSPPRYGALTLSVLEGGVVPGTVRDPADTLTVAGDVGRVFYSNGGKITVAATGRITGVETDSGTAAPPGSGGGTDFPPIIPAVDALHSASGTLDVTVAGRVASDLRPPAGGTLKLSVLEGGVVEGTVHDPEGPLTVAGGIERLLYSNGGKVTVAATGALTGVRTSRGTEALRSDAGTLDATVAGRVAGDLRPPTDGALKLSVLEGGVVEGTVHDPEGPLTVAGSIGRLFYSNGGEATIGATGALTGVEANGRTEALRSENGDLRVTVAGRAVGDILGLGDGEHDVIVRPGGVVTGAIRLAASTAQVDGAAGAVFLDRGGAVAVGPEGRIAGVGGVGIRSAAGDFTATVEGVVVGNIHALGDGARTVDIQPGGVVTGNVYVPDGDSAGAAAVSVARGARVTGAVEVPRAENLELDGAVGKVSAVRGGVLTVGPDGRVTGTDDDTPDVSSETGDLTVVIQLARGETEADAVMRRVPGLMEDTSRTERVLFDPPDSDELLELGALASGGSIPSGPYELSWDGVRVNPIYAPRAQVYEALPSVLLGLNEPSGFRTRMAAPRASNGMWARTQAWTGARDAKRSTSTGSAAPISLKHRGYGLEAGMDIPLGDGTLLSVSAHRRTVSADVSGGAGDIDVVGNGVGASLAVDLADSVTEGAYADARVSATSYSARLSSGLRGSLQRDADGVGHAVSLEAGRRIAWGEGALGETTLTPRALFLYSRVDMDAFTDSVGARVSLKEGVAKTGRAGLRVEAVDRPGGSLLFASVDVEREFAPETRVRVSGFPLESESESTRVRAELGGALEWGEGAWALQAAARYASGADDYGGGVSLRMRF